MRSVWSRVGGGLGHRGLAVGEQAGEQHARLHLGARDRQPVVDPAQRRRATLQRRQAAVAALDLGAHQPQRLGDAVDRAPADRLVAVERPLAPRLPGEPAGEQPQQGARVADVDRGRVRARAGRRPDPIAHRPALAAPALAPPRPPRRARRRRRASRACRRRRGSRSISRLALAHRGDDRGAVARSTCRAAGRSVPRSGPEGAKRRVTRRRRPRPCGRARARSRPRARPPRSPATHSETAPVRMSGAGYSAMSSMLTPARPSASAISATVPGRFSTPRRSSRSSPPTRSGLEQAAAVVARPRGASARPRSASPDADQLGGLAQALDDGVDLAAPPPRGWWRRCPPRSPGWRPRPGSCRESSGRPRAAARTPRRAPRRPAGRARWRSRAGRWLTVAISRSWVSASIACGRAPRSATARCRRS